MCFVLFSWFLIWRLCCASSRNWILRIPYIQVSCSISSFKTQLTNMHVQYSRERNSSISRWLIERASSMVYVGSSYWWTLCHTHGYQDKVNLSSFESTYQDKVNLSKINRQRYETHPFFLMVPDILPCIFMASTPVHQPVHQIFQILGQNQSQVR